MVTLERLYSRVPYAGHMAHLIYDIDVRAVRDEQLDDVDVSASCGEVQRRGGAIVGRCEQLGLARQQQRHTVRLAVRGRQMDRQATLQYEQRTEPVPLIERTEGLQLLYARALLTANRPVSKGLNYTNRTSTSVRAITSVCSMLSSTRTTSEKPFAAAMWSAVSPAYQQEKKLLLRYFR